MAKSKKIFVFVGHPDNSSLSSAMADKYAEGARSSGHEVRVTKLADLKFDPILHKGYKVIQAYEPDLVRFQEDVKWCNHYVTIYPIWWSDMPGLMKGFLDRVWMPGFAFNIRKGLIPGWYRKLKGRSARVIVTSDQHPFLLWFLFGGNINNYVRGILRFSGFAPVRKTWFHKMTKASPKHIQNILSKVHNLGRKGK
jgi:putative NADPH-quinone reductase